MNAEPNNKPSAALAIGKTEDGTVVFCKPSDRGVYLIAIDELVVLAKAKLPQRSEFTQLLLGVTRHGKTQGPQLDDASRGAFEEALEDYDAEAAAREASKLVPSLSELAWQMKNAEKTNRTPMYIAVALATAIGAGAITIAGLSLVRKLRKR